MLQQQYREIMLMMGDGDLLRAVLAVKQSDSLAIMGKIRQKIYKKLCPCHQVQSFTQV